MGKIKTTEKAIKNAFNNIISIGYCDAWYLLKGKEPVFYTCGIYGWNADVYLIDNNTCIVTGYRPFGNIKIDNIDKLNEHAKQVFNEYDYKKASFIVNKMLDENIEKCLENSREI